jgi:tRNA(fMet)-specific endonuclease VapC
MEARFLLDTNICIYIRRIKPEEVLRRFRMLKHGEAALSVITFGELVYGAEKSAQRAVALELLRELAQVLPVLALPSAAAETYGTMRADLERRGKMIGNNDLWIAAHAKAAAMTLVTNNEREFRRVRGLKVENWAA